MNAAECHEIAKRERRIAELEAELNRQANIIAEQANQLAAFREREDYLTVLDDEHPY